MKHILILLFMSATYLHAQDSEQDLFYFDEMIVDSIKVLDGHIIMDKHDMKSNSNSMLFTIGDPKVIFKEMLAEYINQIPSHTEHKTNLFKNELLPDCDIQQVEERDGISVGYYLKCNNQDHVIQVKNKPTFEGFINYILNQ